MTEIKTTGLKVRRILLISDTHGNLDIINQMIAQTNADMVIHAGDFGFYDEQSIYSLSPRELRLLVSHSPVWQQYEVNKQTNRERLIEIVKENRLLGDFPDYISGEKRFSVPVYAVWGNHEDVQVLRHVFWVRPEWHLLKGYPTSLGLSEGSRVLGTEPDS